MTGRSFARFVPARLSVADGEVVKQAWPSTQEGARDCAGARGRLRCIAAARSAPTQTTDRIPSTQMQALSFLAVLMAAFAGAMQTRATDPMIPAIAADLGVSLQDAFLLASAFAMPFGLMQLVLGPTGDALGKVRVIRVALFVVAIGTAVSAWAPSYEIALAARILTGAAAGGSVPVTMALVSDLFAFDQRPLAIARVMIAATSGQILGAAITGLLIGVVGWRGIYVLLAGIVAAIAIFSLLVLEPDTAGRRPLSVKRFIADYREILRKAPTRLLGSLVFFHGLLTVGLFPLLAPLFRAGGGSGPFEAGLSIAAFAAGGLVFGISMRWLAGRLSLPGLMRAGYCLGGIGYIAMAQPLPLPVVIALGFLTGLCFFSLQNCMLTMMTELAPGARGSAVAILLFGLFTGQTVGPILWGHVAFATDFAIPFALAGTCLIVLAFVVPAILRRFGLPPPARPMPSPANAR